MGSEGGGGEKDEAGATYVYWKIGSNELGRMGLRYLAGTGMEVIHE